MNIVKVLALRGPNRWANFPVLEAWVELGPQVEFDPDKLSDLAEWLPTSHGEEPGRCPSLAHLLGQLVVRLQCRAGSEVGFSHTVETSDPGSYRVICAYQMEELGRAAIAAAHRLCLSADQGLTLDSTVEVENLRELMQQLRPTPLARAVNQAARQRNIPVRPLGAGIVALGQGARQRRVFGVRTDRTGAVAEAIARDETLTRALLRELGIPVAEPGNLDARHWHLLVVSGRVVAPAEAVAQLHPSVAEWAVETVEAVGLDVAGVVIAASDIDRPLAEREGVVSVEADPPVEVAAAESVGEALVAGLFAAGDDGRIPVVAVSGVNGKTTTTRLIAHILGARRCVGMTCTDGIYVDGQLLESGDCSGPRSAQTVLHHPEVEAAVLETARGGILRAGLGYDLCDVAVVTNVGEGDHLGLGGIETVEQLARVKRVVVEGVRSGGTAVLNAADPLVAAMASHCAGSVTYFANSPNHPVITAHLATGGRAVFVRDSRHIFLAQGKREKAVASLRSVPLTGGGRIGFQVENVLAAVAAAWALRVGHREIREALRSFGSGIDHAQGRFNLIEMNGAVAVLDYGHNTDSLAAIIATLDQFPPSYRTAVYTAAGDRRDADMIRQAELLGDAFERVVLFEDGNCTRGREPGEIMGVFRKGLAGRTRVRRIQEVVGAVRAVDQALASARPGELLLIQVDVVEETMDLVRGYLASAAWREVSLEEALARLARAGKEQAPQPAVAAGRAKSRKLNRAGTDRGGPRKVRRGEGDPSRFLHYPGGEDRHELGGNPGAARSQRLDNSPHAGGGA